MKFSLSYGRELRVIFNYSRFFMTSRRSRYGLLLHVMPVMLASIGLMNHLRFRSVFRQKFPHVLLGENLHGHCSIQCKVVIRKMRFK